MAEKRQRDELKRVALHQRRKDRKERAYGRVTARQTRTPAEQLALLDKRLGRNVGAARERARLETSQ